MPAILSFSGGSSPVSWARLVLLHDSRWLPYTSRRGWIVYPARVLLIAVLPGTAYAQQQSFTWQQIRDKFEGVNPTLLADKLNIDESKAQEITAYLRPNPQLTLSTDGTQIARDQGFWKRFRGTQNLVG